VKLFLLTRLWQSAVTLFLASIVIFVAVRALPGDPAYAMVGEEASPEMLDEVRAELGLDQPAPQQYLRWLTQILAGDLGRSTRLNTPVTELLAQAMPVTLWLAFYSMVIAVVLGIALGVLAERKRGTWGEWVANAASLVGLSVPNFWLGIAAIFTLAAGLGLFPASGYVAFSTDPLQHLAHLFLPAVILGTSVMAAITRQTQASMTETMRSDFVRTARAMGLSRTRTLLRYGLRNSLIVVVTIVGLQLGVLISGAVVTEQIFALPGFGRLLLDGLFSRDYPVIQATVLVVTLGYILVNFGVDILYSVINPRIRVGGTPR
jgi:peptide/nickel transport system permease protein